MRIAILGSIVLKKATDFLDRKFASAVLYAPKLSLAAIPEHVAPLETNCLFPSTLDEFTRTLLNRDINKTFIEETQRINPDVLLIDFIDEVFDLLVNQITGTVITKSNYLARCNVACFESSDWLIVERSSELGWTLWEKGCDELLRKIPTNTKIVLVRIFQPERYQVDNDLSIEYSPRTLERIRQNNEILKRCYSNFIDKTACRVIDIPIEKIISKTPESRGFNPTDLDEKLHSCIARSVAAVLGLEGAAIPPLHDRIENLFNLFGSMLDAGDVPSIYELHTSGLRYLQEGNLKRARWCERLIMLLRNSSVPLSVEMGKVMFGYGGIGVVVHAQCKLGDYVNIGTNVTLGGGKQKIDRNGISRNIPNVEERVYIATGAKLIGGITIGHHSIIGANAVVTTDIPPFSVAAGNPAKIISNITLDNLSRYVSYFYKGMSLNEASRLMFGDTNAR